MPGIEKKGEKVKLEKILLCLNHLCEHSVSLQRGEFHGDCRKCINDPENNLYCRGYRPINVYVFEVKQKV